MPGDAAMEDLRRRARSSVESVDEFVARGQAKLDARRWADALSEFEAALSMRPGDARILELVGDARRRVAELRDRIGNARRLMADRQFRDAVTILREVLDEVPDDLEAKSLLPQCERGLQEGERLAAIERSLAEAGALEAAGETAQALERLAEVDKLDPDNEVARTRRELIERKFREEKALRELADEHLADGHFSEAVDTLQRLQRVNPAKAAAFEKEITAARRNEGEVKVNLGRAEQALQAREYRRAGESAQMVLNIAVRHPRAVAIHKDCEKAVSAIDRFLAECDKYLATEMFDEALDALDKARERGATHEEHKHRREACEQGRLALLKTDATRSIVMKDFEAAIAAYENVLEVRKDDPDALKGKRAAERRLVILTTEPLSLRLGTAALVLLSLGLVQYSAIASTMKADVGSDVRENEALVAAADVKRDTRKLEADLTTARAAEDGGDWAAAGAAYDAELQQFPGDARLVAGAQFASAVTAIRPELPPLERLGLIAAAGAHLGEEAGPLRLRQAELDRLRDAAVVQAMAEAAAIEATDSAGAFARYQALQDDPVAKRAPAIERIDRLQGYLNSLKVATVRRARGDYKGAAGSYFAARDEVRDDPRRSGDVSGLLKSLGGDWISAVRLRGAATAGDEQAFYESVVTDLAEMVRTLGLSREEVLRMYSEGK